MWLKLLKIYHFIANSDGLSCTIRYDGHCHVVFAGEVGRHMRVSRLSYATKRKFFRQPVLYYNNSVAVFNFCTLKTSGDVEINPGPLLLDHDHPDESHENQHLAEGRIVYTSRYLMDLRRLRYSETQGNSFGLKQLSGILESMRNLGILRHNRPRGCRGGRSKRSRERRLGKPIAYAQPTEEQRSAGRLYRRRVSVT